MLNSVACKSSSEGTFWTKRLSATIVACGVLRVNCIFGYSSKITECTHSFLFCGGGEERVCFGVDT